jgi:hypothetical protein
MSPKEREEKINNLLRVLQKTAQEFVEFADAEVEAQFLINQIPPDLFDTIRAIADFDGRTSIAEQLQQAEKLQILAQPHLRS